MLKKAKAILPVSGYLEHSMKKCGLNHPNYIVVNNVVDDFFFERDAQLTKNEKKQILHISCFTESAKNVRGIIKAIKGLCNLRSDFELVIVGSGPDFDVVYKYAKQHNLLVVR